jgi:hypothetical protein
MDDFRGRGLKSSAAYPAELSFRDVSAANGMACGAMKRAAERLAAAGY